MTFVDPAGMDDINIFFGLRAGQEGVIFGRRIDFPNFEDFSSLAEAAGHTLKVINEFTSEDFLNSLRGKDTWTFFIGHSAQPDASRGYVGIDFTDGYLAKSIASSNKFAGVFACESADYAFSLITGPIVFAVDSRGDLSSAHGLAQSGYSVIRSLIMGKPIGHAAVGGSLGLHASGHPQDLWDKVVVRDTKSPFTRR